MTLSSHGTQSDDPAMQALFISKHLNSCFEEFVRPEKQYLHSVLDAALSVFPARKYPAVILDKYIDLVDRKSGPNNVNAVVN